MGDHRHRRSGHVSLSASTYARLAEFCDLQAVSMASVVELVVRRHLELQPENLLEVMPAVAVPPEMYRKVRGVKP
jgi:hypothetical protein